MNFVKPPRSACELTRYAQRNYKSDGNEAGRCCDAGENLTCKSQQVRTVSSVLIKNRQRTSAAHGNGNHHTIATCSEHPMVRRTTANMDDDGLLEFECRNDREGTHDNSTPSVQEKRHRS